MAITGCTLQRGGAGSGHQRAALAVGNHVPGRGAEGQKHAFDVDALDALELLQRHVHQRCAFARHPGIGEASIDLSQRGNRGRKSSVHLRFIPHIAHHRMHP